MAKQLAFYVDSRACIKCKACQIACKDKNNLPVGILWRRVFQYGGGNWVPSGDVLAPSNLFAYSVSVACMHCQNPLCVNACPTQAMHKRNDGVVLIDADKCIGCRYCEWACPYGAPQFDEGKGVMTKCDFCADLQDEGGNPACVDACVMRCLHFGELEDLQARYGTINSVEPLPSGEITNPSFVITPHKNAQPSGSGTGWIMNLPEEI